MSRCKSKGEDFNYLDMVTQAPDQFELARIIRRSTETMLEKELGIEPTPEMMIKALAWRCAEHEHADMLEEIDIFLRAQRKPRTILKIAQVAADAIWAKDPKKRINQVADILSKRGLGSYEYLRKNLVKPPVT